MMSSISSPTRIAFNDQLLNLPHAEAAFDPRRCCGGGCHRCPDARARLQPPLLNQMLNTRCAVFGWILSQPPIPARKGMPAREISSPPMNAFFAA